VLRFPAKTKNHVLAKTLFWNWGISWEGLAE